MRKECVLLTFAGILIMTGVSGCMRLNETQIAIMESDIAGTESNESGSTPIEATVAQLGGQQQITDMSEAYNTILNQTNKEFIAGYMVDDSFLMWLNAQYGDLVITKLAQAVENGNLDPQLWYDLTGNSIHVLWLDYCSVTGFQRYQLDQVYWKDCAENQAVLSFVGDINFAEDWYTTEYMDEQENGIYDCFSEELLEQLNDADVLTINNEFTFCDIGTPLAGKPYTFRASTQRIDLLEVFGTDLINLANNHVYDYGEEGLRDTLDTIKTTGIPYVGAGKNIEEAKKIVYFVLNGKKIAIVSATEIERTTNYTQEATNDSAGVLKMLDPTKFIQVIQEADKTSDYVIAIAHWGTEGRIQFDSEEHSYAAKLVAAGADAIIGGHPHRLQGCEFIEGVPVAYSLGNFWFSTGTLYTTVAQIVIDSSGNLKLQYVPCIQEGLTTRMLTGQLEKEEFFDYLAAISYDVGIDADGFVYEEGETEQQNWLYDSDICTTPVKDLCDNDGNAIDIVGNLK